MWLNVKLGTRQHIGTSHVREREKLSPSCSPFPKRNHRVGEGRETAQIVSLNPGLSVIPSTLTAMLLQITLAPAGGRES